ncbi:MAG: hypothetical protein ACRDWE_00270 [Acidimicrobiales bacterium]
MAVASAAQGRRKGEVSRTQMAAVEAAASNPRAENDGLYGRLLDQVVGQLAVERAEPRGGLAAAGQAVRGTAWAGYRNGRARLASAAAAYLTWLAPPKDWATFETEQVGGRRPIGWRSPAGESIVDLLGGGSIYVKGLVPAVRELHPDAAVIRAMDLLAPTRSVAYQRGAPAVPLLESEWWFAEDGR